MTTEITDNTTIRNGIYKNLPEQIYRTSAGVSVSDLKHMLRSPQHYIHNLHQPSKQTASMSFGSLFHQMVLESHKPLDNLAFAPDCERRSNADKEAWANYWQDSEGKIRVDVDGKFLSKDKNGTISRDSELSINLAELMSYAVIKHPMAGKLLEASGDVEMSAYDRHKETGILRRVRMDKLINWDGRKVILDLKTTDDASYQGFQRSIYQYKYHMQAAYYMDTCENLEIPVDDFILIAVEKTSPYGVCCYRMGDSMLAKGKELMIKALDDLKVCQETGKYKGYANGLVDMEVTKYE